MMMAAQGRKLLALADRIDRVEAYSPSDMQADIHRVDKTKSDPNTRVILINVKYRAVLSKALWGRQA